MALIGLLAGIGFIVFGIQSFGDFRRELLSPTRSLGRLFVIGWLPLWFLAGLLVFIFSLFH